MSPDIFIIELPSKNLHSFLISSGRKKSNGWKAINVQQRAEALSLPGMDPVGSAKHWPLRHPADPHQDLVTMQEVGQASPAKVDRSLMVQEVVLETIDSVKAKKLHHPFSFDM